MDDILVAEGFMYRILPPSEWDKLKPIFDEQGWFLPPNFLATAAIAENEEGEIVSVHMLQFVLHGEPRWTHPDYVGKVNYQRQTRLLEDLPKERKGQLYLPGFLVVCTDETQERMAELQGFTKIPGTIWRKEFE
jgi:hypothetical protein